MNKKHIIILSICMLHILLSGCKKVENELIGTWDIMTFDTRPEGTMRITFDRNMTAIRVLENESGTIIDSCTYEVNQSPFKKIHAVYCMLIPTMNLLLLERFYEHFLHRNLLL